MRKKLTLFVFVGLIQSGLKSQDFGFEAWDNVYLSTTVKDPRGWASFNVLTHPLAGSMSQTVFQETNAPFAGLSMAKIVTQNIPSAIQIPNPFQLGNLNTVGLLVTGIVVPALPPVVKYGKPYTWRPTDLTFKCKYLPVGSDSAFVLAYLTRWNTNVPQHRDTIARGLFGTNAIGSISLKSLNMVYDPLFNSVYPDSQHVYISSSYYKGIGVPQVGSTLYIDDLKWLGWNGIDELNGKTNFISCYPNPAKDIVTFKSSVDASLIELTDITGKLIEKYSFNNNEIRIPINKYINGLYFYCVKNNKKEILGRGKFEVKQ